MSLLSGLSTPFGAYLVTAIRVPSAQTLASLLGLASGVMLLVTATDLVPLALRVGGPGVTALGMALGLGGMSLLQGLLRAGPGPARGKAAHLRMLGWFVAIAMALHDLPEGMAIGAGDMVEARVGILIALAIALHNIPEGMSIAAPLAMGGVKRLRIMTATVLIGFVTPAGTLVAASIGRISPDCTALMLALAGGAMAYVVARDTLPESLRASRSLALWGLVAGAALMLGVHHYLGG